jgi:hypothetical protein
MVTQVARQSPAVLRRDTSSCVDLVADEWMPGGSKVDSYLVRPASCNPDLKQTTLIAPLKDINVAVSWFPGSGCGMNGLQDPVWNRTDRSVNFKFVKGRAPGS